MKYPQLVHMPGDVEHWLEKQLEARGINGIICAKYILSLLAQVNTTPSMECFECHSHSCEKCDKRCFQVYCDRQSWDFDSLRRLGVVHYPMSSLREKCDVEKLVDELCAKLKEIENNGVPLFDVSTDFGSDITQTNAPAFYSNEVLSGELIDANEAQPFLSFNSIWTRGLLHDSEPVKDQSKMEDYFSSLFYENPSDNFGFEFTRLKSGERQDGKERDRIHFYNKQNLLASECTERLYERNTDMDRLIAKFDANVEGIWKPYESEDFSRYETLLSENILTNSYLQSRPGLIWSFGQTGNDNDEKPGKCRKEDKGNYKSSFSAWSKFSSPVITSSNFGILNNIDFALSKWSSMDGQNDANVFLNHRRHESCFTEVIPKFQHNPSLTQKLKPIVAHDRNKANGDEEDLLTSAKTHFRPIRMEEMQANQTVAYEDGTTFAISNELEKVNFTRSNSGVLYLDADNELDTPRKYLEYKEREITTKMIDSESDSSSMEEFVPKFRVRQSNEKCCQTEDVVGDDQIVPSLNETECESDSDEFEGDDFFFPGDSELAEDIASKIEGDGKVEFRRMMKSDCNCNDIYVGVDLSEETPSSRQCVCNVENTWFPVNENDLRHEWNDIWCSENTYDPGAERLPMRDEYFRFREELTQEGEQLLSDLSCLQMLYSSSKWVDDESVSDCNEDDAANEIFCSAEFLNKLKQGKLEKNFNSDCRSDIGMEVKSNDQNVKLDEICEIANENWENESKRKNFKSQKIYSFHEDGQCQRSSFGDPAVPLLFSADTSRIKEDSYELTKSLKRPFSF